ncbi:MAG: hypothetical protein J6K95_05165 [Rikenellaceae bacterium]|nr:hypothetical protein [Rikenellaceae bacterium]
MENKPVERNTAREAEALEKEKRAKNQAWDFITQRGLLDDFLRYVESGQLPPTHDKRPQTGYGRRIEVSRYSLERLAHVVRGVRSPLEWVEGLASILRGYSEMLSDI